jgi:hypothetical protein
VTGLVARPKIARIVFPLTEWRTDVSRSLQTNIGRFEGANVLALVTEWTPFRQRDLPIMRRIMPGSRSTDVTNSIRKLIRKQGFEYHGISRPANHAWTH